MTDRRGPSAEAGFTLIEIVVALALAGLVSLILMHGVGLTVRGVDRLSDRVERLDQRRALEALLRRSLELTAAIPVFEGRPAFVGQPDSLSFLSIAEDGGPGLYRIKLALDAQLPDRPLMLTRQLVGSTAPRRADGVLAHHVRRLALAYFGAPTPGVKSAWHSSWHEASAPPDLVRLSLDDGDGGSRPPIVVRLWQSP
jgi:general secretion pathway protein J